MQDPDEAIQGPADPGAPAHCQREAQGCSQEDEGGTEKEDGNPWGAVSTEQSGNASVTVGRSKMDLFILELFRIIYQQHFHMPFSWMIP